MSQLSDTLLGGYIRLADWGESGNGKTSLLGQLLKHEELRPLYVFDFDLRIESLIATVDKSLWQYLEFDQFKDKFMAGDSVMNAEAKLASLQSGADKGKFKTVALDSVTSFVAATYRRVLQGDGKAANSIPQLQHHLLQMTQTKDFLSKCCGSNFNFIATFHEGTDKDELTGRVFKAFDVTGKDANKIPNFFNEIWHSEVIQQNPLEPAKYVVRTRRDAIYTARTTFSWLQNIEPIESVWGNILLGKARLLAQATEQQAMRTGA